MEITKKEITKLNQLDRIEFYTKTNWINHIQTKGLIYLSTWIILLFFGALIFPLITFIFFIILIVKTIKYQKEINKKFNYLTEEFFTTEIKSKNNKK